MASQAEEASRPKDQSNHTYHASAYVLEAKLDHPVPGTVDRSQTLVELPEDGQYKFRAAEPFQLFGVLSYRSGYTQVSGHRCPKSQGHRTLATSVVEGLNVLDVITADRVVGQIATEHPVSGQVPSVTFLGTHFVNLRIGGRKIEMEHDLGILGLKPARDESYLEDAGLLARVGRQYSNIRKTKKLPDWARQQFQWDKRLVGRDNKVTCSLVNRISGVPGTCFGHVIDLPDFGRIFLSELCVGRKKPKPDGKHNDVYTFHLRMIRVEMGCIGTGNATIVAMDTNGGGSGGTGGH